MDAVIIDKELLHQEEDVKYVVAQIHPEWKDNDICVKVKNKYVCINITKSFITIT